MRLPNDVFFLLWEYLDYKEKIIVTISIPKYYTY